MSEIYISDILTYLMELNIEYSFSGDKGTRITGFSSLKNYKVGSFTWIKNQDCIPDDMNLQSLTLVITSNEVEGPFNNIIRTNNSKRVFFLAIEHFYDVKEDRPPIGDHTFLGPNVKLGKNVRIGHNCTLDGDITVGDNTIIWNNVTIINRVVIGENCEIQSGTVIGHDGFGYTEDSSHIKTMIKHYGGVRIGDNVLISSNVCVVRGTIDDTIIENGAKVDNLSHVAHNCFLGQNSALAFPCFLGGSSRIENNGYVVGAIIRNQCTVHENGFVGMGAVVTKDVLPNTIVIGNPAKEYIQKV